MFSVFCVTVKRPVLYIKSQFNSLNFVTNSTFRKDSATLYVAESCGHLFDNIGGIVIIFVEKSVIIAAINCVGHMLLKPTKNDASDRQKVRWRR